MTYPLSTSINVINPIVIPIGSMYGIYANIWGILMVNVTIYSIHGSYGIWCYMIFSIPTLTHVHHSLHGRRLFPRQSASLSLPAHGNGRFHNSSYRNLMLFTYLVVEPPPWKILVKSDWIIIPTLGGKWNIHVPKPPTRSPSYSHCCWMYTLLTTIKITIAIVVGLFNGTSPFLMGKLTINGHFHIMKIYWWHWWFSRYLPADPLDKRPLGLISEVHGATNATRFVRQALGKKRLENHWKTHFQNGFSHGFSHGFFLILDVLDCSGGFSVVF